MTGAQERYSIIPEFRSEALGLPCQLIGDTQAAYETYTYTSREKDSDGKRDIQKVAPSVVFYLREDRVVGVMMVKCHPSAIERARRWVTDGMLDSVREQIRTQAGSGNKRSAPLELLLATSAPQMIFGEDAAAGKCPRVVRTWSPTLGEGQKGRRDPEKEADSRPDEGKGHVSTRHDYYSAALQSGVLSRGFKDRDQSRALTQKDRYDHMALPTVPKGNVNLTEAGAGAGLNSLSNAK